jgi:hypothetical protein
MLQPGSDPARGSVVVVATRRYKGRKRRKRVKARLKSGRYKVSLGKLRVGRWRFATEFRGDSRYGSSRSRILKLRVRKPRR